MFTSEPSLAQRIERMIGDTPIVDPFSRIRCDQPGAADLASLMFEHGVRAELISAGMPSEDLDPALPPDERVRRSIPYLARTRNTASSWCLFRIFRDLYDFGDSQLTESNYRELLDKVDATAKDPGWAGSVLRDRSRIRAVVTVLGNRSADLSKNPDNFYYRLDAGHLFCPTPAGASGRSDAAGASGGTYFDTLTALLGEIPRTTERLEASLFEWLDRTMNGRVRFASTFLPIDRRLNPPDETYAQFVLNQASDDWVISENEVDGLSRFVSWSILRWHHEREKPFQIAAGVGPVFGEVRGHSPVEAPWSSEMAGCFRHFSGARFALLASSPYLAWHAPVLARHLPNVCASGDWGHNFLPATLEQDLGYCVQVAPATKVVGFVSDADSVEWSYGRLQVVRKAMARAFAGLVEARYFEEEEVPPLLRQILHDSPRDLYDLGEP